MQDSICKGAPQYIIYIICEESDWAVGEKHFEYKFKYNSNGEIMKILEKQTGFKQEISHRKINYSIGMLTNLQCF